MCVQFFFSLFYFRFGVEKQTAYVPLISHVTWTAAITTLSHTILSRIGIVFPHFFFVVFIYRYWYHNMRLVTGINHAAVVTAGWEWNKYIILTHTHTHKLNVIVYKQAHHNAIYTHIGRYIHTYLLYLMENQWCNGNDVSRIRIHRVHIGHTFARYAVNNIEYVALSVIYTHIAVALFCYALSKYVLSCIELNAINVKHLIGVRYRCIYIDTVYVFMKHKHSADGDTWIVNAKA